ncbi:MAG: hypothetical protein PUD31_07070 [Solobacterium sp.]|nr:hypothetical protein [Solobacterium sp.]
MKKEELLKHVGKVVTIKLYNARTVTGTLEYISSWSEKYEYRCPNRFLCGEITFRAIDVLEVKENICLLNQSKKY